jgi:hypothetical protein
MAEDRISLMVRNTCVIARPKKLLLVHYSWMQLQSSCRVTLELTDRFVNELRVSRWLHFGAQVLLLTTGNANFTLVFNLKS